MTVAPKHIDDTETERSIIDNVTDGLHEKIDRILKTLDKIKVYNGIKVLGVYCPETN